VQAEQKASAARRFDKFLDRLTANLREGESVMDQPPPPEAPEQSLAQESEPDEA
jgi:hypothetical protein